MSCCLSLQGRISRRVTVPLPDEAGRAAILGVHLRGVTLDESAGDKTPLARQLATLTAGFSGAHV
jgi:ATP-dependent Zn protease